MTGNNIVLPSPELLDKLMDEILKRSNTLNNGWKYTKEECNYCGHKLAKDHTRKLDYIICVNPECQRFHSIVKREKIKLND